MEAAEVAGEPPKSPGRDTTRIYQLLSEIQAESDHMVTNLENFHPWFFDNNNSKVITV